MYQISETFGVENNQEFFFVLGVLVLLLLLFSLGFKAITTYVQTRFVLMREFTIGKRFVKGYLSQPYDWFLNRNSADLGKNILSEVSLVVGGCISAFMKLIANIAVSVALVVLLIVTDPKLAIITGLSLGLSYGIIYKLIYSFLIKIGKQRVISNQLRFTAISEAFGAIKEVKVGEQQTEIDPRSKTTADQAFNLIGTGGPELEVQGQGKVMPEKRRKSKAY